MSWTPPASDGGSPIVQYKIASQPGTNAAFITAPATSGVIEGLTNGVTYTFTVRATNAAGWTSVASVKSNEVVPGGGPAATAPGAPTDVTAVAGDQGATVSWTPPADDGGSAITGYRVNVKPGDLFRTVDGPATSLFFDGLTNGVEYTFTVRASNTVGNGAYSSPSNPVTPGGGSTATVPDPPTNVTAVAGDQGATVSWTPPANNGGSAITGYRVNVKPGDLLFKTVSAPATSVFFDGLTNGVEYTFTVRASNTVGNGAYSAPSNPVTPTSSQQPPAGSGFTATTPRRVLDTRFGTGGVAKAKIGAGKAVTVTLPGLPADVTAATLNVTVTNASSTTWLSVYPAGSPRPTPFSNVNVKAGQTVANLAVTKVGSGGTVSIYNAAGTVDIIADLIGHYSPSVTVGHSATTPTRVLDTRNAIGVPRAKVGAGKSVTVTLPDLPPEATAATLNITALNASTLTYLVAYPAGTTRPSAYSNVNLKAGQTVANLAVVPVRSGAQVTIYNAAGTVDIIADLIGHYSPNASPRYTPVAPQRVLDTRTGIGGIRAKIPGGQAITLTVPGLPADATAVTLNITATNASTSTYLVVYASTTGRPSPYSNINLKPADTVANLALSQTGTGGKVRIYNHAGAVDVIADLIGYDRP